MRMTRMTRMMSLVLCALVAVLAHAPKAQAVLLVYEPFDYAAGSNLQGQGGTGVETGFAAGSTWSTFVNNTSSGAFYQVHQQGVPTGAIFNNSPTEFPNPYTNTLTNLPTVGNFAGRNAGPNSNTSQFPNPPLGADHLQAWRAIDPSVTATFQDGTSTWFSFVSARGFNLNARAPTFALGEGILIEDRGNSATGPVIAVGGFNNNGGEFTGQFKNTAGNGGLTRDANGSGDTWVGGTNSTSDQMVNIVVARIDWGATPADPDLVTFYRFLDSEPLLEATFNFNASSPFGAPLNQSTFNMLSIGGGRYFVDELRIGTTFLDVVSAFQNATPVPEPGVAALLGLAALAGLRRRRRASSETAPWGAQCPPTEWVRQ